MDNANDLLSRIEAARLWNYFHKDGLLQIAWRIDLAQTVKIDLATMLREAVEFNQWNALAKPETPN